MGGWFVRVCGVGLLRVDEVLWVEVYPVCGLGWFSNGFLFCNGLRIC